jgi:hypothetical protein
MEERKMTRVTRQLRWILALVAALVAMPLVAIASDVAVAVVDVTAPTGEVTLAPGGSAPIVINMTVTGNQAGTATFEVYRDWTLSGGTFTGSNPQEFEVGLRAGGDSATTFSTSGTVSVAAGQADGTFKLEVGAFDITNSNATGAKLAAGASSNYSVTVEAPAGPKYTITPLFDTTKAFKAGGVIPIKLRLSADNGITINATGATRVGSAEAGEIQYVGESNGPDGDFRYDPDANQYIFNLSTKGMKSGKYELPFLVYGDDYNYKIEFEIK